MNESEDKNVSVLLPQSRAVFFVRDPEILQSARALSEDWRYARVDVETHEGDVETAIETLSQEPESPGLLIIETETIDESFTSRLEALSEYCSEDTAAIIVGPVNDVGLYRKLINMGVSDYLVRPLEQNVLGDVIARTLIDRLGTSGSRLIAFVGAKGGVGTSTLAQATALGIGDKLGQKVAVLDGSGGWSYLSVAMGTDPSTTLREAVRAARSGDEDSLRRMLHQVNERVSILASGGDPLLEDPLKPESFEALIDRLMQTYPVLVVDLSMTAPLLMKTALSKAHEIAVISTPTLSALRSARALMQEIRDIRGAGDKDEKTELVVNMRGQLPAHEVARSDVAGIMDQTPAIDIAYDPKFFLGLESENKTVLEAAGGGKVIDSLMPLALRVLNVSETVRRGQSQPASFLDKIKSRVSGA